MKSRLVRYTFLPWLLSLAACGGGGGGGDVSAVPATSPDPTSSYVAPTTTTAPTQPADATVEVPSKWEPPVLLQSSDNSTSPYGADVAFDLNGNALAVWHYSGHIWSSRYDAATQNWSTAETINDPANTYGFFPKIAFDSKGNAIAAWEAYGTIWANYYSAATGQWGTAARIDVTADGGMSHDVDFAFDGNGNALAVWDKPAGRSGPVSIWYNRYDAATGLWGTPEPIENDDLNVATRPKIAVAQNGDALAVWEHRQGVRNNIMVSRYTAATRSWGIRELLESDDLDDAWEPDIAIDPNGNAIAVWRQGNGKDDDAVARRYVAATDTWGTQTALETLEDDVAYVRIVVDANGDALALWAQSHTYNGTPSIFYNRYDVATDTWGSAAAVDNSSLEGWYPELTIGANGNAMAIWWQGETTTTSQVANYYDATTKAWGVATPVETSNDTANYGAVAVAPDGTAVAIWTQSNALWVSRYQQ